MTYNYSKKNFTFDASISPLAYNMKICTDRSMDVTAYGIKPGHKTVSQYGSTAELKMRWAIAYNIIWQSRVFFFTDYSYIQADWENTLSFEINRFPHDADILPCALRFVYTTYRRRPHMA